MLKKIPIFMSTIFTVILGLVGCLTLSNNEVESKLVTLDPGIAGTWYNSFCSKVVLTTQDRGGEYGVITGTYSSTTGSSGSYKLTGYYGKAIAKGTPLAMGIYWHDKDKASSGDASWHWNSSFSGQYQPAQHVDSGTGYSIPETIQVLNMLYASATFPSLNDQAPLMWPETLEFTKTPPSYCKENLKTAKTLTTISYSKIATGTVKYVTGTWETIDRKHKLIIKGGGLPESKITAEYYNPGGFTPYDYNQYAQSEGQTDIYTEIIPDVVVAEYSLYLNAEYHGKVMSFVGGVPVSNTKQMHLYTNNITSTDWGNRYIESSVNKLIFYKIP